MRLRIGSAVLAVAALAGCGAAGADGPPAATVAEATPGAEPGASAAEAHGRWEPVARSPLSARNNAVIAWTGEEVLVFGGERFHCGGPIRGSSSCAAPSDPPLRDGAAYDPEDDSWRRIARAPVPMLYASTAVVGDTMFVAATKGMFAYDLTADAWRRMPAPAGSASKLVAIGDLLVAYRAGGERGRDQYWEPEDGRWRALPPTPGHAVFEREMVDAGGVGVLVGRVPDEKGNYSDSGLSAVTLDPDTRTWAELRFGKGRDAAALVSFAPQPLHAADGKVVSASFYGDRLPYTAAGQNPLIGGILDLQEGWTALPARPYTAAERAYRAEREATSARITAENPGVAMPAPDKFQEYPFEPFSWLNVGGDGFVVAGRWAYDAERGTWQHVPDDRGPLALYEASAVWAGDRVFAWGGSKGFSDVVATGWTWRPYRPLLDLG